jgi:hypothetical protein
MKVPIAYPPTVLAAYDFPTHLDGDRWAAIMNLVLGRARIISGRLGGSYDINALW